MRIRNAALRGRDGFWTITVTDGVIASVQAQADSEPAAAPGPDIDAAGHLVTEPFVDTHLHLCKVHTLDLVGDSALTAYTAGTMGDAGGAIMSAASAKAGQTREAVTARARTAVRESIRHGVRRVQAFADVDSTAGLTGVEALLELKQEVRDVVDLRVVAFPQDGLLCAPGTEELIREAVRLGVDVVGGIPWLEHTDADAAEHVRRMVDLAEQADLRVAMLVDDAGDPGLRTTEMLASALVRRGMIGRASAQHARASGLYPEPYLHRLIQLCRTADLGFVSDPHTGPLHLPVFTFAEAGLGVALGQDDIEDAYYPFGRHNMLEVAFLAAHLLGARTDPDLERLYDMVTVNAARVIGAPSAGITPGAPADLVVLQGRTLREALTHHTPPRHVVVGGTVVASTEQQTTFAETTSLK